MSNSFYNHGAFPSTGSAATSASMRAELDLVAAGFDKMPTLAGNANKFVIVNSTGTGLTQTDVLPAFTVTDTDFTVQDDGDNTRKFQFNAGSITTGNTRVYVMPDLDTTLVGTNVTQTLTNKTLTAPVIATIVNTGTLTLPTSTDTLIGRNTTDTLTNKTLTNPVIGTIVNTGTLTLPTSTDTLVGRQTTDTLTNKTISGASNTLSNIANGSLSNSSIVIGSTTLSLGGTMTTLAGVTISGASNTLSNIANASLTNSSITINGSTVALGSSVTVTATATNALTIGNGLSGTSYNGSSAVTIAINTGVTADLSTAQTFSNKTISGSANTLTNIANASLTNSAITIGSTAISLGATSLTLAGLTSASATTLISTGNQATSVAISAIGHSSGTVTVTTSTAHGLTTGDTASIDGVADYTFCGVYTVTVTNANVFTYSQTASGASSSGGFSTKLTGTWGLYAGGTGPSLHNGPVIVSASSQMPALRVTQGGSGYALIVEDAANPDTSAFIISNAGDLAINTNKFTVAAASGNTLVAGTLDATGNFNVNTNKFSVVAASGNTLVAGTLDATGNFNVNTNKFSVVAASGNTTIAGTTSFGGNIVSNLLFTDATYDIGASGATRPRDLFLSRNLVVGGTLTLAGGVNLNGNVTIGDASTDTLTINSTITSNLIFTDNTYDIGASGATRPRTLYLGTSLITPAITNSGLTSGRVTFAGTAGLLQDSANFTYSNQQVTSAGTASAGFIGYVATTSAADGYSGIRLINTGASGREYQLAVGGSTSGQNGNFYVFDVNAAATRLIINSSGNWGAGTSPSAWISTHRAIQLPGGGSLYNNGADGYINLANNFYYDGTDWRRVTTAPVSAYLQSSSGHLWGFTGTGAAGSICGFPATLMTLTTSGLTVTGAVSATENITAGNSGGNFNVVVGNASANWSSGLTLKGSNTNTNWEIGQNRLSSSALTFAPSTAGGGSTFTTSAMTLSSTGLTVDAGILTVTGTGSRGVRLQGLGAGEVAAAGDGSTYVLSHNFYNTTSYATQLGGLYTYVAGGAFQYLSIGPSYNSQNSIYVNSSGNVGIGFSTAAQKLDVNGTIRLTPNTADTNYSADIFAAYNSGHPFQINVKNNGSTFEMLGVYADGGGSNNRIASPSFPVCIGETSMGDSRNRFLVSFDDTGRKGAMIENRNGSAGPAFLAFRGYDWTRAAIWHDRSSGFPLQIAINPNTTDLTVGGCTPVLTFVDDGSMRLNATGAIDTGQPERFGITYTYPQTGMAMNNGSTSTTYAVYFKNPNGLVGNISTGGTSTTYNTSSDYRLKNNIAPMTGALARLALLKPVTYKWKADGSDGEGFIAHELAEIFPQAVSGEKDAVDPDGKIRAQGIDTSFLVATLTAAIQELKAEFDAYKASHP